MKTRITGYYGDPEKATRILGNLSGLTRYIDEKQATKPEPNTVPVIWAVEAPSPEAAVVAADGTRGLFAFNNSGCPRNPQVINHLKNRISRLASTGFKRIVIDELNYPTPHDGKLLHSCLCKYCTAEEPKLLELRHRPDPGLIAEARQRLISRTLREAAEHASRLGVALEAAVHPPLIASLAGQNYETFLRHVDRIQVMLYHRCPGPACLNREYAMLMRLTGQDPYSLENPDRVEREREYRCGS